MATLIQEPKLPEQDPMRVADTPPAATTTAAPTAPTAPTAAPAAPQPAAAPAEPSQAATGYNAPGASDTVEGRITGLLGKDSDYMKRAETKGAQYANQRGLLNTSMAVGAAEAARIDAALPIAQQDADWANRNRMQADTMAQERGLETYKQEMLAWDQFLKGVSDISMQDLDPAAKDKAVQNLRDNYFAGSGIASSLRGVTIENGNVVYGEPVTSGAVTSGASTAGGVVGEAAPTAPPIEGAAPALGAVNDPRDLLTYDSKESMDEVQKNLFEQKYGEMLQPPQVKTIKQLSEFVDSKYAGQKLNVGGEMAKQRELADLLQKNGIPVSRGGFVPVFRGEAGDDVAKILGIEDNRLDSFDTTKVWTY